MPQAVQSLPYVAWVLMVALTLGSLGFVGITRRLTDATTGYLRFTAFSSALLAMVALAVDLNLSQPTNLAIRAASAEATGRQTGLALISAGAVAYSLAIRSRWSWLPGLVIAWGAALCLLGASFGWTDAEADAVPLLVQLVVLSVATGGSMAAVILGHWYLVTPKISEKPLVLQARLLMGVVGLQVLLFFVWTTLGGGPGQDAFEAFSGSNLLLVVLRLIVTLLFPLVLCWMAWRTALTRSMESATGLLYINLAAVMAGTIGAAALYVSSGLLL
jgi:hypothetical protein